MAEEATKSSTVIALRWVGVLPVAVIGSVGAWVALTGIELLTNFVAPDLSMGPEVNELIKCGLTGYSFVCAGVACAPSYEKASAFVLGTLGVFLSGVLVFFSVAVGSVLGVWACLATAVGCGFAAWQNSR